MGLSRLLIQSFVTDEILGVIIELTLRSVPGLKENLKEYINQLKQLPLPRIRQQELEAIELLLDNWYKPQTSKIEIAKLHNIYRYVIPVKSKDTRELVDKFNFAFDCLTNIKHYYTALKRYQDILSKAENLTPTSAIRVLRDFRETIVDIYNELSTTQSLDLDKLSDYLIIGPNQEELEETASQLLKYLSQHFGFYKSGITFLDNTTGGIEASTLHIIAGASNHGKSLFMLNMMRQMITNNNYTSKHVFVWITLEDSIYRLIRRLISIFGNIRSKSVRHFYQQLAHLIHQRAINPDTAKSILSNTLYTYIIGNHDPAYIPRIVLKHSDEYSLTTNDIRRFIEFLRAQGFTPVAVFLDYLDLILPSKHQQQDKEYNLQGYVVQELRAIAAQNGVPIITATQNQRLAEDPNIVLSNRIVGDSYKKIRYSDYVYMIRQNEQLPLTDPRVLEHVYKDQTNPLPDVQDLHGTIIPVEIAITKAKDAPRNISSYLLFNQENLRFYNDLTELTVDLRRTKDLDTTILQEASNPLTENLLVTHDTSLII